MCIYIAKKIHEQKVFIQLSITRFPTDDKSVIHLKNLVKICFENNTIR